MTNKPKVSILSACYNQAPYLDDFFNSIIAQDYRPLELILNDDCSTDGSQKIIESWFDRINGEDIEFEYNLSDRNYGMFEVFPSLYKKGSGDIVATLECDDLYKPGKISKGVELLEQHPEYSALHTEVESWMLDGSIIEWSWKPMGRNRGKITSHGDLLFGNSIYTCTFMCRKKVMDWATEDMDLWKNRGYMMYDYPLCLKISKKFLIAYMDEPLSVYRLRHGSASKNPETYGKFVASYTQINQDARDGLI